MQGKLTFANTVEQFDVGDCDGGVVEVLEAEHGPGSGLNTPMIAEERTIKGSYMGSTVPSRDLPRFVALFRAGLLPVDRLLTHRLKLEEINTGFDRLAQREAIRQVVLLGGQSEFGQQSTLRR